MRSAFTSVPDQRDPGLELVLEEIFVARAPVLGDDLDLVERGDGDGLAMASVRGVGGQRQTNFRPARHGPAPHRPRPCAAADGGVIGRRKLGREIGRTFDSAYLAGPGEASVNSAAWSG